METIFKTCSKCLIEKPIEFGFYKKSSLSGFEAMCKNCVKERKKIYQKNNKEYFTQYYKEYRIENKEKISVNDSIYYQQNKERIISRQTEYYINNKEKISEKRKYQRLNDPIFKEKERSQQKINKRKRLKNDINYRIRENLSNAISKALKKNSTKKTGSVIKYLSFNIEELKIHLESLFEPWMNWSNRGIYSPQQWVDNDPKTWTWQLDHIIPQSDLPYDSMEHENFKKCWSLDNLRPLSSKQNLLDGLTKVRHNKDK